MTAGKVIEIHKNGISKQTLNMASLAQWILDEVEASRKWFAGSQATDLNTWGIQCHEV